MERNPGADLWAGAARVPFPATGPVPLMGYGHRQERSTGQHDPIAARALYLRSGPAPEPGLLLLSLELCLVLPQQADTLRANLAREVEIPATHVLVACTHTHSAPDTGLDRRGRVPDHVGPLFAAAIEAGREAVRAARPARLRWLAAEASIGRNRCRADRPHDPRVDVLEVQTRRGEPLATAFLHGCHPTVLGHENLEISGDWPGVACAAIEAATGAPALFVLTAHGDVDPRTRGLMDLAIPGQSLGAGFEAARILGLEVADAVLAARGASSPGFRDDPPIRVAEHALALPLHLGDLPADEVERHLASRRRDLAQRLAIDPDRFPRLSELDGLAFSRARSLPPVQARTLISAARRYLRDKTAPFYLPANGATDPPSERRATLRISIAGIAAARLLGLPVEATTRVGLDWRARMRHHPFSAVTSITNGWLRYLPHAADLADPDADLHYEPLNCIFAPGAAERVLDTAESLAREL